MLCTRKCHCTSIFKIISSSLIPGKVCVMSNLGWLLISVLLLNIHGQSFHWGSYMVLLSFSAYLRDLLFFQWFRRVIMLYVSLWHGSDESFKDSIWQNTFFLSRNSSCWAACLLIFCPSWIIIMYTLYTLLM